MAGGTVVWSTNIGLAGVGGPTAMTAELGSLAVGSTGAAIVAVPWWSTASVGQLGLVGVQLYQLGPDGSVTTLEDVGESQADTTSDIGWSLNVAGAADWAVQVRTPSAADFYVTTAGLPNGPGSTSGPLSLGAAMDPLGNSFVVGDGEVPDYVQKFDGTGQSAWGVAAGATETLGVPYSCVDQTSPECWALLAPDGLGGVVVPGYNESAYDYGCGPLTGAFLMRLGPSGTCVWSEPAPEGAQPYYTFSLLPAGNGEVYVAGPYLGTFEYFGCPKQTSTAAASTYVVKLDGSGSCVWAASFDVQELAAAVRATPDGDVVVAAPFSGTIDFGGKKLTSVGSSDLAVARLSGVSGAALWSESFGAHGAALSFAQVAGDAMGGTAMLVIANDAPVDLGGGPISGPALVKLEEGGVFGWQSASFGGQIAVDPCGAVITATTCTTPCAPGGPGFTVQKLAP